jgi:hypothetical protein
LSSTEAQHVVNSLWRGDWIQRNNENDDIDYVQYDQGETHSFWEHLNPDRMSVPRYQTAFRMVVWIVFLFGAYDSAWVDARTADEQVLWRVQLIPQCIRKPSPGQQSSASMSG